MKQIIWAKVKVFLWCLLGAGILATLTFIGGNLDLVQQILEKLSLGPEMTVLIVSVLANVIGQISKAVNQHFSLEEKIGRLGRALKR